MKKQWVVSVLLLFIVGMVAFRFYQMQRLEKDVRDIREIPIKIGQWKAQELPVKEHDYEILETRNLVLRDYRDKEGESVHLFVIYSETNRRVCHPPVVCLIGSGFQVTKSEKETLSLAGRTFTVNRLIAKGAKKDQLVLFWYMLGDEFTDDYVTQQLRWVLKQALYRSGTGQATGKPLGGAMIRIVAPITDDEAQAFERAKRFLQELLPILIQEQHV